MNPRPLGYEPYEIALWRLKPSLANAVTSADRTDPISLRRLRLPRLKLSAASGLQIGLQNRLSICRAGSAPPAARPARMRPTMPVVSGCGLQHAFQVCGRAFAVGQYSL